jgi:hypothetical protein
MIVLYAEGGAALDVPTFVASGARAAIEPFGGGSVVFINTGTPRFTRLGRNGVPLDQLPHPVPMPISSIDAARCGGGRCFVASDFILRRGITDLITPHNPARSRPKTRSSSTRRSPSEAAPFPWPFRNRRR